MKTSMASTVASQASDFMSRAIFDGCKQVRAGDGSATRAVGRNTARRPHVPSARMRKAKSSALLSIHSQSTGVVCKPFSVVRRRHSSQVEPRGVPAQTVQPAPAQPPAAAMFARCDDSHDI